MKAFMLLELDKRPINLKGNKIFMETGVPLNRNSLSKGMFKALPSSVTVELVTGGLLAKPVPEARNAFAVMKPIGMSISGTYFLFYFSVR